MGQKDVTPCCNKPFATVTKPLPNLSVSDEKSTPNPPGNVKENDTLCNASENTVKPLLGGNLRDLPKCLLNIIEGVRLTEVVKIAQCLLTISIQRLLCTVIKLHVVKEAMQCSSSLPFITNFNLFVKANYIN